MAQTVQVISGSYKDFTIKNMVFSLARPAESTPEGRLQVRNAGQLPTKSKQVYIDVSKYTVVGAGRATRAVRVEDFEVSAEPEIEESDDDAMNRIKEKFDILEELGSACIHGNIRSLIVSGPPGVGKSHGIGQQIDKYSFIDSIKHGENAPPRFDIIKGKMSAIVLYTLLYKFAEPNCVLVLDDCDIWHDEDALNILKGALDSGKTRRIHWNTDARLLKDEGIPNFFDFRGSVIFITNLTLDRNRGKMSDHIDALKDRSHYLDLTIDTVRDKMLRVRQVHRDSDGGLFRDYEFEDGMDVELLDFMWENRDKLTDISMRMAKKIADLVVVNPDRWQALARNTCFKRGVK